MVPADAHINNIGKILFLMSSSLEINFASFAGPINQKIDYFLLCYDFRMPVISLYVARMCLILRPR